MDWEGSNVDAMSSSHMRNACDGWLGSNMRRAIGRNCDMAVVVGTLIRIGVGSGANGIGTGTWLEAGCTRYAVRMMGTTSIAPLALTVRGRPVCGVAGPYLIR